MGRMHMRRWRWLRGPEAFIFWLYIAVTLASLIASLPHSIDVVRWFRKHLCQKVSLELRNSFFAIPPKMGGVHLPDSVAGTSV